MDFDITSSRPFDEKKTGEIAQHYQEIIRLLGENPDRQGLLQTPQRVARAMQFFLQGYEQDAEEIIRTATFTENYRQMVIVKDIDFIRFANIICFLFSEKRMLPISPTKKLPV